MQRKAFWHKMTPPDVNSDNYLFKSGGVIHFGTPDWIRTSGLQSRSLQAVKRETVGANGFVGFGQICKVLQKIPGGIASQCLRGFFR